MKKTFFTLFLLLSFNSIFAQKNFYGAGLSYSILPEDFGDGPTGLTSLSLNYERKFAKKWSCSIIAIGQKSKLINSSSSVFSNSTGAFTSFDIKTRHRLFGFENLYIYHPNGFEEGTYFGFGLNVKLYSSVNTAVTPNTPASVLYGTGNIERNILLSVGYTESFEAGFRFNPFVNLAVDPFDSSIFPIEFRLGCNFMFGDLFFKNLKKKE